MVNAIKQKSLTSTSKTFCEPDRIRTYDRLLRREVLYPAELRARNFNIVGVAGFEPATSASQTRRDNRATLHPDNECISTFVDYKETTGVNFLYLYCSVFSRRISGETGIRTLGTLVRVRRFSKPLLSATQAPLQ